MTVAREDRADHREIALSPRVVAVTVRHSVAPRDLRRARALVGEGRQDQPVDVLGRDLRVGAGANRARRRAVHVQLLLACFLHQGRDGRGQISQAARNVGIVAGRAGAAVAVVVHGPDIEAVAGEHVHERILPLAGHAQVIAGARRIRRAVYQEHNRLLLAALRGDTFAVEIELHVAFVRPVFARLNFRLRLALSRRCNRNEPGPCSGYDGAACDGAVHEFLLRRCWRNHSKSGPWAAVSRHDSALETPGWISTGDFCSKVRSGAWPRSRRERTRLRNSPRSPSRNGLRLFAPARWPKAFQTPRTRA